MLEKKALTGGRTSLYAARSSGVLTTDSRCPTTVMATSSGSVAASSAPRVSS